MWPCCLSHFFDEKILVCKVTSKERVGFVTCSEEKAPGGQWCKATLTSTICSKECSQRFHTGLPWARMEHLLWRLPQWQCWEGNCLSESLAASPESGEGIPCIQDFSYIMSFHKQTKSLPIRGPTSSIYQRRRQFALMFFFHRALSTNSCHCSSPRAVYFTSMCFFYPLLSRQTLLRYLTHGRQSWLHCVFKRDLGAAVFWITMLQMPVTLRYLMYYTKIV